MPIARKNLRFACTACGACCEKPGWVFFDSYDRRRAARFLKIPVSEFRARHGGDAEGTWIRVTRRRICPFFAEKSCSIYSARPVQCRTYPFWPENMRSWIDWNEVCRTCPGAAPGGPRRGPRVG